MQVGRASREDSLRSDGETFAFMMIDLAGWEVVIDQSFKNDQNSVWMESCYSLRS